MAQELGRLLTAMVTPFGPDGAVDLPRLKQLASYLVDTGSDGLVAVGTTGESPTLSHDEKLAVFRTTVEAVGNRATVIAGTGANDTRATVELSLEAERLGVHGLLLIAPYYNKPNQEGLYQHFRAVAERVRIPIILYNHPPRTGVCIAPDTLRRLAEIPTIVGLKDSSADLDLVSTYRTQTPPEFRIYSGNDSLTLPIMALGGHGVISVASHLVGRDLKSLVEAVLAGRHDEARSIHYRMWDLMNGLFMAPSPAPVKAALEMLGMPVGGVRLPLVGLTETEQERLRGLIEAAGLRRVLVEA